MEAVLSRLEFLVCADILVDNLYFYIGQFHRWGRAFLGSVAALALAGGGAGAGDGDMLAYV